jgi:hypothetical protein
MDFLKKNYEKLILGVVLLGLVAAVGGLPFKIGSDKANLEEKRTSLFHPKVKELTNLDLTISEAAIKRASSPTPINFSEPNKLLNPMPWQKKADDQLIRADKVGPTAAMVTNIAPLYLRLTLDSVTVSDTGARYVIGVQREAAPVATQRAKKQTYSTLNSKNDVFTVIEVKGKAEDPTALILQLNDTGEQVAISKDKPFTRVDGYMADVRYPPENKFWPARRVGASLLFNNEEYSIVAVNAGEIVLSAKSNGKKWTIRNYATPAASP